MKRTATRRPSSTNRANGGRWRTCPRAEEVSGQIEVFPNTKMRFVMIGCIADLMCGAVRSRPGEKVERVVAAAGGYKSGELSIVEIYDLESNTWTKG